MTLNYTFSLTCPLHGEELHHRDFVRLSATRTQAEMFAPCCLTYYRVDVGLTAVDGITLATGEDAARARAGEAIGDEQMSPVS